MWKSNNNMKYNLTICNDVIIIFLFSGMNCYTMQHHSLGRNIVVTVARLESWVAFRLRKNLFPSQKVPCRLTEMRLPLTAECLFRGGLNCWDLHRLSFHSFGQRNPIIPSNDGSFHSGSDPVFGVISSRIEPNWLDTPSVLFNFNIFTWPDWYFSGSVQLFECIILSRPAPPTSETGITVHYCITVLPF